MFGSNSGFGSSGFGLNQNNQQSTFGSAAKPLGTTGFGSTSGNFSAPNTLTSTGFGQSSSGFGSTTATPGFGTNSSLFGSTQPAASSANTGFFGSNPAGSFGAQNTNTTGFGMQASGFGSQNAGFGSTVSKTGTSHTPFEPRVDRLPESGVIEKIQCITAMDAYLQWSQEELRAHDYEAGNKFGSGNTGFGLGGLNQTSTFGANKLGSTTASGSLFGSSNNAFGLNSSSATSGFGTKPATTGAFGSSQTTGFGIGANQASNAFGSSLTPNNAFGTTQTTNTFGSNPGAFGSINQAATNSFMAKPAQTGFGGFGQQTTGFGANTTTAQPASTGFGSSFGQTNTTSGFGSAAKPATTGFSFGNATSTTTPATNSLFGNSAANSTSLNKPATSFGTGFGATNTTNNNIFGNNTTSSTQSSGLFGNKQPSTAVATGGLFGQQNTSSGFGTNTQQAGGFSFGNKTNAFGSNTLGTNPTNNLLGNSFSTGTANNSTGLFGNNNTSTLGNTTNTGSLLGNNNTTTSLFGNSNTQTNTLAQNQPSSGFGLGFNSNNTQQQNTGLGLGGSLFGNSLSNSNINQSVPNTGSSLFGNQQQNAIAQNNTTFNPLYASANQNPFGNNPLFKNLNAISSSISSASNITATPIKSSTSDKQDSTVKKLPLTSIVLGTPKSISSISRQQTKSSTSNIGLVPTTPRRSRLSVASATPIRTSNINKSSVQSSGIGMFSDSGFLASESTIRSNVTRLTPKQKVEFPPPRTPRSDSKRLSTSISTEKLESANKGHSLSTPESFKTPNSEIKSTNNGILQGSNKKSLTPSSITNNAPSVYLEDQNDESVLNHGEYWTSPSIEELRNLSPSKLKSVNEFMCGRHGYGQIRFDEPVDLTSVGAIASIPGQIILFANKVCTVYPDDNTKPPRGSGLNVPAVISLENCWPLDKSTREPIKSMTDTRVRNHIRRLKRIPETEFLDFVNGKWIFKVSHFSKYGIDDDDDDDDDDFEGDEKIETETEIKSTQPGFQEAVVAKNASATSNGGLNNEMDFDISRDIHEISNSSRNNFQDPQTLKSDYAIDINSPSSPKNVDLKENSSFGSTPSIALKASDLIRPTFNTNQSSLFSFKYNADSSSSNLLYSSKGQEPRKSSFFFKNSKNLKKLNENMILGQKRNSNQFSTFNHYSKFPNKPTPIRQTNNYNSNPPSAVKGKNTGRSRPKILSVKFSIDSKSEQAVITKKAKIEIPSPSDAIYNCLSNSTSNESVSNGSSIMLNRLELNLSKSPKEYGLDAGIFMSRSFRVGFGPGGSLVWINPSVSGFRAVIQKIPLLSESPKFLECSSLKVATSKDSYNYNHALYQLSKATIEAQMKYMQVIIPSQNSEINANSVYTPNDCPKIITSSSHFSGSEKPLFIDIFDSIFSKKSIPFTQGQSSHHEKNLWALGSALFDKPKYIGSISKTDYSAKNEDLVNSIKSKKQVTDWLQNYVKKNVINDLNSLNVGSIHNGNKTTSNDLSAKSIFYFLSGNQIDKACLAAASARDYHLATLISQIGSGGINGGGNDVQLQELIKSQLLVWDRIQCDNPDRLQLSLEYKRLYNLISGKVDFECSASCKNGSKCCKLDWLRSLGMVLWYTSKIDDTLLTVVEKYKILIDSNKAPQPLPMWACSLIGPDCDYSSDSDSSSLKQQLLKKNIFDVSFQLLLIYCGYNNSLENVLHPSGFNFCSDVRLPYMFGWMLNKVHGFRFSKDQLSFDYLAQMMSMQLEMVGLWHYAVFVLLQTSNESTREILINRILTRYISTRSHDAILLDEVICRLCSTDNKSVLSLDMFYNVDYWTLSEEESFLIHKCKIPAIWIAKSRLACIRGSNYKFMKSEGMDKSIRLLDEFRWIVTTGNLESAFKFFITFIAPDCVVSSNNVLLSNLLYVVDPNSQFLSKNESISITRVSQNSWEKEGYTYSTYLSIVTQLPELLSKIASVTSDSSISGPENDFSGSKGAIEKQKMTKNVNTLILKIISDSSKLLSCLYTISTDLEETKLTSYFQKQISGTFSVSNLIKNKLKNTNKKKQVISYKDESRTFDGEILSSSDLNLLMTKSKIAFNHISSAISGVNIQLKTSNFINSINGLNPESEFDFVIPNKSLQISSTQRLSIIQDISTGL
ncbi:Nucleoporin [Smittium culicis]|uniref:Nucleoporin n=2 Tax=Smittium culicis TaxID=133412 RepID=A0A1R1XHZ6_9FUNG|nr:Nucleoporin [Smittium culicis]